MSGRELETNGLTPLNAGPEALRKAAGRIAGRIAARYPNLPGRRIAHDPTARADVLELLDAIGYPPDQPDPQGEHVSLTTEAPSKAALADILDKAADIIDRNGHHKGYLYDETKADGGLLLQCCPVDAVGAINIAVFGKPRWPAENHADSPLAQAAALALEETVKQPVPGWNDAAERTQEDVITSLWETAERLRKQAA